MERGGGREGKGGIWREGVEERVKGAYGERGWKRG